MPRNISGTPLTVPGAAPNSAAACPAELTTRQTLWTMAVLSALLAFSSISTDLFLPALPAMAHALGASDGTMELTIGGYLIGFSLGQLLWGPIGDRYGRRLPIAAGLVLSVAGAAGCALSSGVWELIAWRIVHAIGACAAVVLARAMVRDLYDRDRAAQMLSTLITIMSVAPLLGPLAGGQILAFASWRAIFWVLAGMGLITLAALFTLPETLPFERRDTAPLGQALLRYAELLRNPLMLGYAGAGGLFYVGVFAFIAGTPFIYISYYGVPAQLYGLLFGASVVGIMTVNMANARLVTRLGSDRLLLVGTTGAAVAGVVSAAAAVTGWGGIAGLAVPLLLYCSVSGFIIANSVAGALSRAPEQAGAVSALVGAIHWGIGIAGSALVGVFADGTPHPLGLVVAVSGIGSLFCICFLLRPLQTV